MTGMTPPVPSVVITSQPWRVPAGPVYLEGRPTEEQRLATEAEVREQRACWKPGKEAYELLDRLRAFVGHRVRIQFWDTIMHYLDDEAPFPLEADCLDVVELEVELDDGVYPQAYLVVANEVEIHVPGGFSRDGLLVRSDLPHALAPVAAMYEVSMAPSPDPGAGG